jgi:hypothetical protein
MPVQSKDYGSILWNHYLWCLDQGRDTSWWHKLQAPSSKHQAPSTKRLDKSSGMGYSGTITDGKAHHAQPNAGPSIPPGSKPIKDLMKAVASPEVGTLKIKTSSLKLQALQGTSNKLQAPSYKVQAPSHKQQAPGPRILHKVSRPPNRGA